jgi:tRNA A-37 threonylcarbamoyl transferase component Bud32
MRLILSKYILLSKESISFLIKNFSTSGSLFGDGTRNNIKLFDIDGKTLNIKSFKKPRFINKIVYQYFRKSKARRSFEFATFLLEKGIGTPQPYAFAENFDAIGLTDSYYVSEHLIADLTFRELVEFPDFPERDKILRQFTQFSYLLHQKGIEFKDHSPGNTLIVKNKLGNYDFFLVDLNRMEFHENMDFNLRMKNLSRLTPFKDMVVIMSNEYAKISGEREQMVFETLWKHTTEFQLKYDRKKKLKKKFHFSR